MERVRVAQPPSRTGHSWSLVSAVFLIALAAAPLSAEESPAVMGPALTSLENSRQFLAKAARQVTRGGADPVSDPAAYDPATYTNGWAKLLNDRGQVAGDNAGPGLHHAFLWSEGVAIDMGTDEWPLMFGMNTGGQVVGYLGETLRPFLFRSGRLHHLETTAELPYGAGWAINDRGQVAGEILALDLVTELAALWDGGAPKLLGTLMGGSSAATGINKHGQAIGWSSAPGGLWHVFFWENDVMIDLTPGALHAAPVAINDRGQVLVSVSSGTGGFPGTRGILWERGVSTDLGTLGGAGTLPYALNHAGQVTGLSLDADGRMHAFLWDRGVMTDIGPASAVSSAGCAINDRGQVVVESQMPEGIEIAVWDRGNRTLLPVEHPIGSTGYAINKHGQVMGSDRGRQRPYVWDRGTMIYLLEGVVAANVDVEEASSRTGKGSMPDAVGVRTLSQAGIMELSLILDRAGEVQVSLYDVTGRLLASRAPEHLGAGQSTLRWDSSIRESGLYFARVRTETGTVTRKWTVLR